MISTIISKLRWSHYRRVLGKIFVTGKIMDRKNALFLVIEARHNQQSKAVAKDNREPGSEKTTIIVPRQCREMQSHFEIKCQNCNHVSGELLATSNAVFRQVHFLSVSIHFVYQKHQNGTNIMCFTCKNYSTLW